MRLLALQPSSQQYPRQDALRFGKTPFNFAQLDDVFVRTGHFEPTPAHPYGAAKTETLWKIFPKHLRRVILPFLKPRNIAFLEETIQSKRLGVLEEAADVWHESMALMAAQEGWLSNKTLQKTIQLLRHSQEPGQLIRQVADMIKPKDLKAFSKAAHLSKTEAKAFLVLTYLKFSLLKDLPRFQDPIKGSMAQLWDECDELLEQLPMETDRNRMHTLQQTMQQQSIRPLAKQIERALTGFLKSNLSPKIKRHHLFEFFKAKHDIRQGITLSYYQDPKVLYNDRKAMMKPFEALAESALIRKLG